MTEKQTAVTKAGPTQGERFTNMVLHKFSSLVGKMEVSPHQKRLAQHLFLKIDASLKELEGKRIANKQQDKAPIVWANLNLDKLAIDAVHRIDLGLDALIDNHIHVIPYRNKQTGKYDVDLRIGYAGRDYYRRRAAVHEPKEIVYELVYSSDHFRPIKRSAQVKVEGYEFEITKPFERGDVIGGFAYLVYENMEMNKLVLVSEKDFQRSKALAQTDEFWDKNPIAMRFKTLVHRATGTLTVDPRKVDESYWIVEAQDQDAEIAQEIAENANQEYIDVVVGEDTGEIVEEVLQEGEPLSEDPSQGQMAGPGF